MSAKDASTYLRLRLGFAQPALAADRLNDTVSSAVPRRTLGAVRALRDPARVLEQFMVGSWEEHLRQHERVSRRDEQRLDEIVALTEDAGPPTVTHWLAPETTGDDG